METQTTDYVMVTNWDKVDPDDFYLSDKWEGNISGDIKKLRKMAKSGELFYGYVVSAKDYCIYRQMDAHQILIDDSGAELVSCESDVIGNKHEEVQSYEI